MFAMLMIIFPFIYEFVSVKTGLNDIQMKIKITALLESTSFSQHVLKI